MRVSVLCSSLRALGSRLPWGAESGTQARREEEDGQEENTAKSQEATGRSLAMGQLGLGVNVFDAAVQRLTALYRAGHRVVVALSGGKDSTVCLELAVLAARECDRLPVEAFFVDEEVSVPGVAERGSTSGPGTAHARRDARPEPAVPRPHAYWQQSRLADRP